MKTMTPAEAAWVRHNAWSDALRTINGDYKDGWFFYRACSCQLGVCVRCTQGRCDQCLTRQHGGRRLPGSGHVLKGMYPCAQVWDARYDCGWTCPHDCVHEPAPEPAAAEPAAPRPARHAPPPRPVVVDPDQLGLFQGVSR